MKALALVPLCLLLAVPAWAEEAPSRPRLVAGGMGLGESRTELYRNDGVSLGAVSRPGGSGHMSMGGFAAYAMEDGRVATSLRTGATHSAADLSASYHGVVLGVDGTAAMVLNYEWGQPRAFSPNPQAASVPGYDLTRPTGDLSLSLSFTHDLNPAFTLGGFAATSRAEFKDSAPEQDFRLGAGLGVKF